MFINKNNEVVSYEFRNEGWNCKGGKIKTKIKEQYEWNHNYSNITFVKCMPCFMLSWFFNLFYCIISSPIIFVTSCFKCNLIKAVFSCCPPAIHNQNYFCTCVLNDRSISCCPCIEPVFFIIGSLINLVVAIISDIIFMLFYILSCGCFCYYCFYYNNYKSCCYHIDQSENMFYGGFPNYVKMVVTEV